MYSTLFITLLSKGISTVFSLAKLTNDSLSTQFKPNQNLNNNNIYQNNIFYFVNKLAILFKIQCWVIVCKENFILNYIKICILFNYKRNLFWLLIHFYNYFNICLEVLSNFFHLYYKLLLPYIPFLNVTHRQLRWIICNSFYFLFDFSFYFIFLIFFVF